MNQLPQPEWLRNITYGLADGHKVRLLIDGTRFAVVQSPGGRWYDNSGGHYGGTTFYLVDKSAQLRKAHGLLDCRELQHGGRAKTALWKLLVENSDKLGHVQTDCCGTCMQLHYPHGYYNHNFVAQPKDTTCS